MQTICVQGTVSSISSKTKNGVIFNLKCGEITYKVTCPFFCPVQDHDSVYIAECEQKTMLELTALVQPYVTIPEDKDRIKEQFFKILRGSGFGQVSASRLYDHISDMARSCGYGKDFAYDIGKVGRLDTLSVNNRTKYSGDGVDAFISEMAAQYNETRDKKLPELFASNRETGVNSGINILQSRKLLSEWYSKRSLRRLYLLGLTRTEISNSGMALDTLFDTCIENPFKVASISMEKAKNILLSVRRVVGTSEENYGRVNRYVYNSTYNRGNTCISEIEIRKNYPFYDIMSEAVLQEYGLVKLNGKVYLNSIYKTETIVFDYLNNLISDTAEIYNRKVKASLYTPKMNFYECKTLTPEQEAAIEGALNCALAIITGAAGTGKSTIIREITRNLELRDKSYAICAFTGKAVSRLHEVMDNGRATTIDRFILDIKRGNIGIPSHIIIDEGSMVTTELFYRLIKAIEHNRIFITIVGDCNQLPPIGWGNLMKEMMNSQRIPLFYLTKNQRILPSTTLTDTMKEPGSASFDRYILENANNLIDPMRPLNKPMEFKEGEGFYILEGGLNTVTSIVSALKSANYSSDDILILSPYKSYLTQLNHIVQDIYLENCFRYEQPTLAGTRVWCVSDRVMMTHNNYDIGVMNGEEGVVDEIIDEGLKVQFKDTIHLFKYVQSGDVPEDKDDDPEDAKKDEVEELKSSDLIHSFAVSVHKSQGSEAKYVILFIPEDRRFTNFLNINLLYTAMTRTKKTLWIVSSKNTLQKISMTPLENKNDGLGERLRLAKNVEKEKVLETFTLIPSFPTSTNSSTGLTVVPTSGDLDLCDPDDLYEFWE